LGSTRTDSKPKPSQSEQAIVELQPPPAFGFSGTAKFLIVEDAVLIEELLKRGYTRVDHDRG
jgi:hypothetical protein